MIPVKFRVGAITALSAIILAVCVSPASAATNSLTITPTEWNVVGLDSNSVTSGPNQFSVGAKVCNVTGTAVSGVDVAWNWTTANTYINLDSTATKSVPAIAANSCTKLWWTVEITRDAAAYNAKRGFTISAAAPGVTTVSTPTTREIYVEKLVSQNRNAVTSVTGPTNVVVGQTVSYSLTGKTATQGYEQLSAGPSLDGTIFEILSVTGTYTQPETGAGGPPTAGFYANACTWDPVTTSGSYRSCLGTGKAGGNSIVVTVTALVKAPGTGLVNANIYDYSGSSYHYNSDLGTYTKSVTATNPVVQSPPVAVDDGPFAATSGVARTVDVPANDTDVDGDLDLTSVVVTTPPAHGTTSVNATTGVVTYTPSGSYVGSDSFEYRICDGRPVCDTATVTLNVTAVPVVQSPPVAVDDGPFAATSGVARTVDVPANDTDVDGDLDLTSVVVTTPPAHGTTSVNATTGVVTYSPSGSYVGSDSFEYRICDGRPVCDTATVTLNVTAVPVVQSSPVAVDDSSPAVSGVTLLIDVADNDSDVDGNLDVTTVSVTVAPSHGVFSVDPVSGEIRYTADSLYTGTDTFTYEICDTTDRCDTAIVTVRVTAPPATSTPPVAADNDVTTTTGKPVVIDVLDNDTDRDGDLDPTSVSIVAGPSHGTVDVDPDVGEVTYSPDSSYTGTVSFTYKVCDVDGNCDTATVTVKVGVVGGPPVDAGRSLAATGADPGQPIILATLLFLTGLLLVRKRRRSFSGNLLRVDRFTTT
ncbi:tandem-95 repeat protein [Cryobacterium sp. TMT1-19]|uniref:Ig-like domain-containing protein n=1 Tax=Cryobacterium sp. TMT1-19 TaxID=1259231 RepID=UPI00106C2060|nr:Ig-like domain-containing protein [Cryobacterium sp. TMT1-19]TFD30853.1 tandem-95 repeat protein [Cryobacterium sp. TMT1-19]